jgi:hypothetical protein
VQLDDKIVFKMKEHFLSVCVTDADTLNTMKIFKKNFNFSLCPHSGSQFDFLVFFFAIFNLFFTAILLSKIFVFTLFDQRLFFKFSNFFSYHIFFILSFYYT